MGKQTFSDTALAIWRQIVGNKGHLNPPQTENLVDILERHLKLLPVMVRYGDEYRTFDKDEFLKARITDQPAGWARVYYAPQDCERMTGSSMHNWTQWANRLLGFKRQSHDLAPKIRPPEDLLSMMEEWGWFSGRVRTFRFLSLETVVFYIAVQTRTWGRPHHIRATKDFIERQDISTIDFIARDPEPVDVDDILGRNGDGDATPAPAGARLSRVPKAGQGLVGYNPSAPVTEAEVDDVIDGVTLQNAYDAGNVIDTSPDVEVDVSTMSDDELEAHVENLQRLLEERKARKLKEQFHAQAAEGRVVGGDVWPDRGQWATVVIEFPDGAEITYYHEQLMREAKASEEDNLLDSLID